MVGPMTGPARHDFVPLHEEVFEGETEIGEGATPHGHSMSDAVQSVHLVAVFRRVAGMVHIGRRNHLLDSLEPSLVPDGGDGTPYHRFVFLCLSREAALHGAQALPQEAPFHPQSDEPVALSQHLTERALSGCLFRAEIITTVHGLALLGAYWFVWSREKSSMPQGATKRRCLKSAASRRLTYRAMWGASLIDVAEILGHKTVPLVRRYG